MHIVTERFFDFLLFRLCIILPYDRIAALLHFDIFLGPSTTGACTYDERDDIIPPAQLASFSFFLVFTTCFLANPFSHFSRMRRKTRFYIYPSPLSQRTSAEKYKSGSADAYELSRPTEEVKEVSRRIVNELSGPIGHDG